MGVFPYPLAPTWNKKKQKQTGFILWKIGICGKNADTNKFKTCINKCKQNYFKQWNQMANVHCLRIVDLF